MNLFLKKIIAYMLDQYQTVLTILAIVSSITYLVLIYDLKDHEGDSALIRLSADQVQLLRRVDTLGNQLVTTNDRQLEKKFRTEILISITKFEDSHISLRHGDRFVREGTRMVHVPGELPIELRRLYFDSPVFLDRLAVDYISTVKALLGLNRRQLNDNNRVIQRFRSEKFQSLGDSLEKAVSFYQFESESRLASTLDMQSFMYAISMLSLAIVGFFILKPLVIKLKESMSSLKEEKDFTENLINTSQAFIIGLDSNRKIQIFNQFAEENTGWFKGELNEADFFEQFIPLEERPALQELFNKMMQGENLVDTEIETQLVIRSGESLSIMWHVTVVVDADTRQPTLFLATGVDITQRKQSEQQLKQALGKLEELSNRLQEEVNFAASVQKAMLPNPSIDLPGLQGQAKLLTSTEVGGDYYDYFSVAGHETILMVGDVSGHGVAAGTMVSAAKAGISALIHEGNSQPSAILHSLNETMLATANQSLLMTMACIRLDAKTGILTFANAGHVLPYLRRKEDRNWEMLEASGLPLGKSAESNYHDTEAEFKLEVGDRLFLFTDGVVEEESPLGEMFGFDRLEELLNQFGDAEPEVLHQRILEALRAHRGSDTFSDDVTLLILNHTDRVTHTTTSSVEVNDIIRVSENSYRQAEHPIPRISRQFVVFLAENEFSDLFPRFKQDGICRALPKNDLFYERLGWDRFLTQHHQGLDDDLYGLIPKTGLKRQFQLSHSEDKLFLMEEIMAWLSEQDIPEQEFADSLVMLLDEMLENSLYAAPRDGQDNVYYQKGEERELKHNEEVRVDVAIKDGTLGLMVTDNWGTLNPSTFLQNMSRATQDGILAGSGGGGLYLMWRMSDYMQIRVNPHRRTQVTVLWDMEKQYSVNPNTGFQFLYHTEQEEVLG